MKLKLSSSVHRTGIIVKNQRNKTMNSQKLFPKVILDSLAHVEKYANSEAVSASNWQY